MPAEEDNSVRDEFPQANPEDRLLEALDTGDALGAAEALREMESASKQVLDALADMLGGDPQWRWTAGQQIASCPHQTREHHMPASVCACGAGYPTLLLRAAPIRMEQRSKQHGWHKLFLLDDRGHPYACNSAASVGRPMGAVKR
jgi:hypothetical protein